MKLSPFTAKTAQLVVAAGMLALLGGCATGADDGSSHQASHRSRPGHRPQTVMAGAEKIRIEPVTYQPRYRPAQTVTYRKSAAEAEPVVVDERRPGQAALPAVRHPAIADAPFHKPSMPAQSTIASGMPAQAVTEPLRASEPIAKVDDGQAAEVKSVGRPAAVGRPEAVKRPAPPAPLKPPGGQANALRAAASGVPPKLVPGSIAAQIEQAQLLLRIGNVHGAREALEPAAKAGSPDALTALGRTYDHNELAGLLVAPGSADPQRAGELYAEAVRLGSVAAKGMLERLQPAVPAIPAAVQPAKK